MSEETQIDSLKAINEISHEILYGEDLVRVFFVKNPNSWFAKEDALKFLKENGKKLAVGTLYNILSKLKGLGFLESRRSSYAEYHLKELRNEIHPIGGVSRVGGRSRVLKLDFFDYLGTLAWDDVSRVHDVRLWVGIVGRGFVDGAWEHHPRRRCFVRRVVVDGLRFELCVNYGVPSLSVSVKCADSPVAVGFEGLIRFYGVLSTVRGLYCPGVPDVSEWTVTQWHYGRDTKGGVSGLDFELSFKDWFGSLCRIYSRHDGAVRAECVENPNIKFGRLLRDEVSRYDVQRELAEIKKQLRREFTYDEYEGEGYHLRR